jgi:tyrosine-specific transport protein
MKGGQKSTNPAILQNLSLLNKSVFDYHERVEASSGKTVEFSKGGTVLGGSLILAGTAIGGGMLALPVLTGAGGFFPAVSIIFLCWLFMTATGLLFLEVFLWSKGEVNIVSMAKMTLGLPGKVAAWLLYLFLFYSLTVAYVCGGGGLVKEVFETWGEKKLPAPVGPLIFLLIFAPFVVLGAKAVDSINRLLMAGLILSFLFFVVLGSAHIEVHYLAHFSWPLALLAAPVVFTSFGYQGTVPSIIQYMNRDPIKVKKAIIWGTFIPLLTYIIWELLILGVIPADQLQQAREQGQSAVAPLKNVLHIPWIFEVGEFFAFFALVTSFLGVTLGLLDFMSDGLKIKKTGKGRLLLALIVFVPPLVFAMIRPSVFLNALHYAGGIGCALLLGLLPILMVWRGRYILNYQSVYSLFGGRWTLSLLALFVVFELILMVVKI